MTPATERRANAMFSISLACLNSEAAPRRDGLTVMARRSCGQGVRDRKIQRLPSMSLVKMYV
jgi:hypothetical protein